MTVPMFRDEVQSIEQRVLKKLDSKLDQVKTDIASVDQRLLECRDYFDKQQTDIRNESLWRIKDAEELIKSRVTQVSIDTQIKALKNQFEKDMSNSKNAFNNQLKSEVKRVTDNLDIRFDHSEQKYADAKAMCQRIDEKLGKFISKEQMAMLQENHNNTFRKFEDDLDQLQRFFRDINIRLNETNTKINKTIE